MKDDAEKSVKLSNLKFYIFWSILAWTLIVSVSLLWNVSKEYENARQGAKIQSDGLLKKDLAYRYWASGHGGLYAPITEQTPPNPYLVGVNEQNITTPSSRELSVSVPMEPYYQIARSHSISIAAGHAFLWLIGVTGVFFGGKKIQKQVEYIGKSDQALRLSEEKFSKAFYSSPDAISVTRINDGVILEVNKGFEKITGYCRDEVLGKTSIELNIWQSDDDREIMLKGITGQNKLKNLEARICNKAGESIDCLISGEVIEIDSEQCLLSVVRDVTNKKKVEAELKAVNQQLNASNQQLLAHQQQLNAINQQLKANEEDLKQTNQTLSERVKELNCLYGLSHIAEHGDTSLEEVLQGLAELIPPCWYYPDITVAQVTFEGQNFKTSNFRKTEWVQSADIKIHNKNAGKIEVCYLEKMPMIHEGPFSKEESCLIEALAGRMGKIIERMRAEDALKANQFFLEKAQEIGKIGTWELDIKNNELFWTSENYKIFGVADGTPLTYEIFLNCVHPEDRGYVDSKWTAALRGKPYKVEHRLLVDGKVKWVRQKADLQFDENGNCNRATGFSQDITEITLANQREMNHQQELAHASRLSIMGQMATELAHELNQPLHAILANAEGSLRAAKSKPLEKNKLTERIETVIKQADRAGKIISRIRAFAAKGMPERKEVQLNDVVSDAMDFMNAELKRCNIKVNTKLQKNIPPVNADHIQIEQVLINLLQNSIDSMNNIESGNRILTIKTQIVAGCIEVSVRDTGCGIDAENQADIFDPFVTSKEQGLGIGLSISRSIIESHGGKLTFRDNTKAGVTLFFSIPAIL